MPRILSRRCSSALFYFAIIFFFFFFFFFFSFFFFFLAANPTPTQSSLDAQLHGTTNPSNEYARARNLPYRTDFDLPCIHHSEYSPLALTPLLVVRSRPGSFAQEEEEDRKMGPCRARAGAALSKGWQDR